MRLRLGTSGRELASARCGDDSWRPQEHVATPGLNGGRMEDGFWNFTTLDIFSILERSL